MWCMLLYVCTSHPDFFCLFFVPVIYSIFILNFEEFFIYLYTLTSLCFFFLTGNPNPPHELHHDVSANTESSAVIQWQSPLYTGGPIIRYTVTTNGQTASVSGDVFTYAVTGLKLMSTLIIMLK